MATPETTAAEADLINRHPDRFLFGTDEVAPTDQAAYLKVYDLYAPLFAKLTPEASEKVRKGNYERLFDEARRKVRAWEKANVEANVNEGGYREENLALAPPAGGLAGWPPCGCSGRAGAGGSSDETPGPSPGQAHSAPVAATQAEAPKAEAKPRLDIYGFAMLDMGYQSGQNDPNWFDVLRPTKLPSFKDEFGEDGHFFAGVRQSRLGVKGFMPTSAGEIKTIFEFELFGTGVDAGQTTFRLRHA